jgi:enediyne biosynthesis protein E4
MAGGVAVFDYNGDGRPDIFFTNGADIATLKKSSAKYSNRLFRNDGNGVFTDVTAQAGLARNWIRYWRGGRRLRQ